MLERSIASNINFYKGVIFCTRSRCSFGGVFKYLTHCTIKVHFDFQKYELLSDNVCLVRQDPNQSVMKSDMNVSKLRTPEVSKDVTVLAPGHMAPSGPTQQSTESAGPAKRKRQKSITGEVSGIFWHFKLDI